MTTTREKVWQREKERGFPFNRKLSLGQAIALRNAFGRDLEFRALAHQYKLDDDEAAVFAERNCGRGRAP